MSIRKVSISPFNKLNIEKWLMVQFKINRLPKLHIVDRYIETLKTLGIQNDGQGLDFFIDPSTEITQLNLPNSYTVYALGGQHTTKQLPLNKQIEWLDTHQEHIVLIGGKEDKASAEALCHAMPSRKNIINLCGQISIHQSALLMQNARLILTHDTGMMHIAAALKQPIHSVWGNTIPEFGMSPYYPVNSSTENKLFEVKALSCRPCSKLGHSKCPKGHFKCMQNQVF